MHGSATQGAARKALAYLAHHLRHAGNPVKIHYDQKPWNMNSIALWLAATGIVVMGSAYPQDSMAEAFTGKEFLTWSSGAQNTYIQTSVTMASIMATKVNKASGNCIAAWYLAPDANRSAINSELRDTISRNDAYHPSAVIFLVLEQRCGPF